MKTTQIRVQLCDKSVSINVTPANRKVLRAHAREALAAYSPVMSWLLIGSDGNLSRVIEPQGQTYYTGAAHVLAITGGFCKSHGDGAEIDAYTGRRYLTQRDCLRALLGRDAYSAMFGA